MRRSAAVLAWNVQHLAEQFPLAHLGFLTLTFERHVVDPAEAQRCFNSLATGVLRPRYLAHIRVFERQHSRRVHYHLIIAGKVDIRTGVDFDALAGGDYRSAPRALRDEWSFWRRMSKAYGFGRTELMPIKSTAEGIGRYVGKYIGKGYQAREEEDKGVRRVGYSGLARMAVNRFAWASSGAAAWRRKVGVFASIVAEQTGRAVGSVADLTTVLGPQWAHINREFIQALPDVGEASRWAFRAPAPCAAGGGGTGA